VMPKSKRASLLGKRESAPTRSGRSPEGLVRDTRRNCGTPAKRVAAAGFFLLGLVDFDRTLEVSTVLDHDPCGGQVAVHRTILLDFNFVLGAKVALHRAIHHHLAGDDVGSDFRRGPDGELPLIQLDQSFN
jgi:hypothetical protein